jgi:putative membrane protein
MKTILRNIFVNFLCFWLISLVLPVISFGNKLENLVFASLALALVSWIVKPLLNLLFLPLNLITLGSFRWIVNIIVLYLVTILVKDFQIHAFTFAGIQFQGFIVPQFYVNSFFAYLFVAFLFSIISDIIYSIFK